MRLDFFEPVVLLFELESEAESSAIPSSIGFLVGRGISGELAGVWVAFTGVDPLHSSVECCFGKYGGRLLVELFCVVGEL